jgi:hypothetical protein
MIVFLGLGLGTVTHAVSTGWHAAGASGTHDGIPVLQVAVGRLSTVDGRTFGPSVTHAAEKLEL